MVIYRGKTV